MYYSIVWQKTVLFVKNCAYPGCLLSLVIPFLPQPNCRLMRCVVFPVPAFRIFPMCSGVRPLLGTNPQTVFPIPCRLGCPSALPVFAYPLLDCRQEWCWIRLIALSPLSVNSLPVQNMILPIVGAF